MKRTTHILTLSTLVLATILITMVVSPADASKRFTIESGDIAFVDVFKLIDHALLGQEKADAREDFNIQSQAAVSGLQQQLAGLEAQLTSMEPSDPNGAAVYQEYTGLQGQLESASQQINGAYQSLIAQQLSDSYAQIYAAANEIGAQEGYIFVFATRTDGELVQTSTITGITQEILARPLMTPPNGVDITELVRIKLGYPEKAPEPVVTEPVVEQAIDEANEPEATEPEADAPVVEDE